MILKTYQDREVPKNWNLFTIRLHYGCYNKQRALVQVKHFGAWIYCVEQRLLPTKQRTFAASRDVCAPVAIRNAPPSSVGSLRFANITGCPVRRSGPESGRQQNLRLIVSNHVEFATKHPPQASMFHGPLLLALTTCAVSLASAASDLPVIFIHGVLGNYQDGDNSVANLTAEGRTAVALKFCDDSCSIESLVTQVPLAVQAVRDVVANNSAFEDGYMIVAHSQGGAISRANGIFTGPYEAYASAAAGYGFLTALVPEDLFNYTKYAPEDFYGKLQHEFALFNVENPDAQYSYSQFSLARWPQFGSWSTSNIFFPVLNNVNPCLPGNDQCVNDQNRRKANFLKVEQAHFFASPDDGVIIPWQSSLFGRYTEVDTLEGIETNFAELKIVNMTETLEYTSDTFGLRALDKRNGIHLHEIDSIPHVCWVRDSDNCSWATIYDQYIYPALQ